jgi:glycyl-tRNA synthetase alpha chain
VTFKDLILKLFGLLGEQGCLIQQPLDIELAPARCIRRRFSACSVRSRGTSHTCSRRGGRADGRFGENPNRCSSTTSSRSILKPAPDDVQDLYLQSLEACGIDLRAHDVRFEEDNWSRRRSARGASAGRCSTTA